MKKIFWLLLFSAISTSLWPAQGIHRFAFIVGANNGGPGRVLLRYAVSDARSIYQVMREMGGLSAQDTIFLEEPGSSDFWAGLADMKGRIQAAREKKHHVEVLVYYSGHASERGLLLGGETVSFNEFRKAVDNLPADVRIAILDACSSGQITRSKGGKMLPPFMLDSSSSMKGYAFLTSSSEDEASQESDTVGGSFFTHYLVSGLRGGADRNQDGKVTLHETYQFAFDETLARTEQTLSGPQHPGYDIQMKGSGDVVLTDVRNHTAILLLDTELWGRFYIRNHQGKLVAELNKSPGKPTELGLPAGEYNITLDRQSQLFTARVRLAESKQVILFPWQLQKIQPELSVKRGDSPVLQDTHTILSAQEILSNDFKSSNQLAPVTPPKQEQDSLPEGQQLNTRPLTDIQPQVEHFSLSVHSKKANQLRGLSFSLAYKAVVDKMTGSMFSLGVNQVGSQALGTMFALGLNQTDKNMQGVQLSLGRNLVGDHLKGVQITLGVNQNGKHLQGLQVSPGVNIASLQAQGIQIALGYNYTGNTLIGIQTALGMNSVRGNLIGAQFALGVNSAGPYSRGLQAGMVNISHDHLLGGQIGLVNIAGTLQGIQVGLINIADDVTGIPLGLINIIRNGNNRWHYWSDETGTQNLGFSMGSRYIYSIYNIGIPLTNELLQLGVGLGLHFPGRKKIFAEVEVLAAYLMPLDGSFQWWWVESAPQRMLYTGRFSLGWKPGRHFALAAGLSYNIYHPGGTFGLAAPQPLLGEKVSWVNDRISSWPGIFVALYMYH